MLPADCPSARILVLILFFSHSISVQSFALYAASAIRTVRVGAAVGQWEGPPPCLRRRHLLLRHLSGSQRYVCHAKRWRVVVSHWIRDLEALWCLRDRGSFRGNAKFKERKRFHLLFDRSLLPILSFSGLFSLRLKTLSALRSLSLQYLSRLTLPLPFAAAFFEASSPSERIAQLGSELTGFDSVKVTACRRNACSFSFPAAAVDHDGEISPPLIVADDRAMEAELGRRANPV